MSTQCHMKAGQTALTDMFRPGECDLRWFGLQRRGCASAVMHGSEVDRANVPGKLTTPSAPLTHAIKATAGDAPLPVCVRRPVFQSQGASSARNAKRTRQNKQRRKVQQWCWNDRGAWCASWFKLLTSLLSNFGTAWCVFSASFVSHYLPPTLPHLFPSPPLLFVRMLMSLFTYHFFPLTMFLFYTFPLFSLP